MQLPHQTSGQFTTNVHLCTVTCRHIASFFSPFSTTDVILCVLVFVPFLYPCSAMSPLPSTGLRSWTHRLHFFSEHPFLFPPSGASYSFPCGYLLLPSAHHLHFPVPVLCYLRSRVHRLHYSMPSPIVSLGRSSTPSSPDFLDAPKLGSHCHPYCDVRVPSTVFSVPATTALPLSLGFLFLS